MFPVLAAVIFVTAPPQGDGTPPPRSTRATLDAHERFLVEQVAPEGARRHLRRLTATPHMAGTPADRETAEYVRAVLLASGFETEIREYQVLLSYPERLGLSITAPVEQELDLTEQPANADVDGFDPNVVPPFNAYSASARVEGEVVYAHYGRPEDFEWLAERGVDVTGKICLIRYGKTFRGLKVQQAQRRGAIGVRLYSEPDDDGYRRGDPHPDGPWRPPSGVQRGSVLFLSQLAGDPLTPGVAARGDVERLERDDCPWLPNIPCLPISWANAHAILRHVAGDVVPRAWQGGCPVTYHIGPGPARVDLDVRLDERIRPIWNVLGKLRSATTSKRFVMLGNHRDSWVHGAIDPNSGSAASLEAARALGALVANGWNPRIEVRYASWDGEEFGLIGSTEWCEEFQDELQQNCLAYFNCDSAVSGGRFSAKATPDLVQLLADCAARTDAHDGRGRILTRWAHGGTRPPVGNLGSGSDYTAFLCRLGISCLDASSGGGHGVYHSLYDTTYTMERFIDPDYAIHTSMARFFAIALYRFASADRAPLDVTAWSPWLRSAVRSLDDLPAEHGDALAAAIDALDAAAVSGATEDQMLALHGAFLDDAGIPSRPWFRNLLVAPGLDLGYGAATLPALAEALEAEDDAAVARETDRLVAAIDRATRILGDR